MADLDLDDIDLAHIHAGTPAVVAAGYREQVEAVARLRAERDALAAALEEIAGMVPAHGTDGTEWVATAECAGFSRARCYGRHPDDPGEWCPVCVAEVAWCGWKMGVLGA